MLCPQDWEARDPNKHKGPATKKPRISGAAVLNMLIGPQQTPHPFDKHQQHTLPQPAQQQPKQHQQQQQPQQQQAKQPQQQQPKPSGTSGGGGVAAYQLQEYMTGAEREALAARQAALQEAEQQVRTHIHGVTQLNGEHSMSQAKCNVQSGALLTVQAHVNSG